MASDRRCVICDRRPQARGEMYCRVCLENMAQDARERQQRCDAWKKAWKYLHWKGVVVGLFANGKDCCGQTVYQPRRVLKALGQLPKSKVIDLDTYIPGFDRQQIKGMKATLKKLAPREL